MQREEKKKAEEIREEAKKVKKPKQTLTILAAGDIHGDSATTKRLAEKAVKENVDLVILTGDLTSLVQTKNIIKPFLDKGKKVIFVPGNWESKEEADILSKQYNIKNIEDRYVVYNGVGIFGMGSKDWALYPDDKETFNRLKKQNDKLKDLEKKIMISHLHAAGTLSELSGVPGNDALRFAIEKFQPDFFIHSHIHELEGAEEKIGKTRVINVGKKGRIIRL